MKKYSTNFSPTLANEGFKSFIDNTSDVLRTDDFYLAVTLFHTLAKLLSIEKDKTGRLIYTFKKIINIESVKNELFSDLFTVKAFSFLESIKAFEKQIDSKNNNTNSKQHDNN